MVRRRKKKKKTINLNPQRNSLVMGEMTRRPTTQEDMDRVREQMRITERNTGRRPTREDERRISEAEREIRERTSSRNRRSETKQKPEEIVLNQPKKEKGFIEETVENVKGLGEAIINPSWPTKEEQEEFSEASEAPMLRGLALAGGLAGLGAAAKYTPTVLAGKGGDMWKGADAAVNQIVSTVRSDMGGGVLGTFQLNAANAGANAAITAAKTTTTTAARIGTPTVSKVGEMAINAKTIGLAQRFLAKFFTKTTTSINQMTGVKTVTTSTSVGSYATKLAWWASSIFLGRWGQAEAPEGVLFPLRDLMETAKTEEDWEVVDQYRQMAEEIADTSIWEEIVLWSPFAALVGIFNKIRGMAKGVEIMKETGVAIREEQMREKAQGGTDWEVAQRERDAAKEERDKEFKQSEKERGEAEEREARIKQEVWRLRRIAQGLKNKEERDKKYDEADALELTIYE